MSMRPAAPGRSFREKGIVTALFPIIINSFIVKNFYYLGSFQFVVFSIYIYIPAPDMPPNIYTALRSDLALIEYPAFDQYGAIFAVMVVVLPVPAPARICWGRGVVD